MTDDAQSVRASAMSFRTVKAERQTTPWLNGQGYTQVVLATDAWRISVADEPLESRFSIFDGWDRVIIPIGRVPLHLHEPPECSEPSGSRWPEGKVVLPLEPFAFPGEWAPTCRCSTRTRALNVMTKRGEAEVMLRIGKPGPPVLSDSLRVFFDVDTEVAVVVPPGAQHDSVQPAVNVIISITSAPTVT